MSDDKFTVAFPDGEVPEKFQDKLDWDWDEINVISIEEAEDAIR